MEKNIVKIGMILLVSFMISGCEDSFLDIEPNDKITSASLLATPNGRKAYLASMYHELPMEDFNYTPYGGFNYFGNSGGYQNATLSPDLYCGTFGNFIDQGTFGYWNNGYAYNRTIDNYMAAIESISEDDILENERTLLLAEGKFFKAYLYFALAKRYGGACLIKKRQIFVQGMDEKLLRVPRSTEKETWDYVLALCDTAASMLPATKTEKYRADKWAALALKSRAALYAASVAKYWDEAPLSGEAVDQKIVGGMDKVTDANHYYQECIDAAEAIMDPASGKSLYMPNPSSQAEATANYYNLYTHPENAVTEVIFSRGYYANTAYGHNLGYWSQPRQSLGYNYYATLQPTLDLVDTYESIDINGIGSGTPSPLITRENGNLTPELFNDTASYIKFDNVSDIFKGKDPRLYSTIILPGSTWQSNVIVIQGGFVRPDSSYTWMTSSSYTTPDNITYYSFGATPEVNYSGFDLTTTGKHCKSGFILRKFTKENDFTITSFMRTTDYIDMGYNEVLLNYCEACVESGITGDYDPEEVLNSIRKRAGFTNDIPLTLENVLHERRVELAMDNLTSWDLMRRREYHKLYTGSYIKSALVPMRDLRGPSPKYIFVRSPIVDSRGPQTFYNQFYYRQVEGQSTSQIVLNPTN